MCHGLRCNAVRLRNTAPFEPGPLGRTPAPTRPSNGEDRIMDPDLLPMGGPNHQGVPNSPLPAARGTSGALPPVWFGCVLIEISGVPAPAYPSCRFRAAE